MRSSWSKGACVSLLLWMTGCQTSHPPLAVVENVEIDRYLGQWYEVASFPQRFQRDCVATKANYSLREDGRIRVENSCRKESFDGEVSSVEGVAWVPDPEDSTAKLEVQFFWPFSGDYWVIDLDPDYRWAVVGHPSREYLWILSRTPEMDPTVYEGILGRIEAKGFDLDQLNRTPQPPAS